MVFQHIAFLDSTRDGNFSVGGSRYFLEIDFPHEKHGVNLCSYLLGLTFWVVAYGRFDCTYFVVTYIDTNDRMKEDFQSFQMVFVQLRRRGQI